MFPKDPNKFNLLSNNYHINNTLLLWYSRNMRPSRYFIKMITTSTPYMFDVIKGGELVDCVSLSHNVTNFALWGHEADMGSIFSVYHEKHLFDSGHICFINTGSFEHSKINIESVGNNNICSFEHPSSVPDYYLNAVDILL